MITSDVVVKYLHLPEEIRKTTSNLHEQCILYCSRKYPQSRPVQHQQFAQVMTALTEETNMDSSIVMTVRVWAQVLQQPDGSLSKSTMRRLLRLVEVALFSSPTVAAEYMIRETREEKREPLLLQLIVSQLQAKPFTANEKTTAPLVQIVQQYLRKKAPISQLRQAAKKYKE